MDLRAEMVRLLVRALRLSEANAKRMEELLFRDTPSSEYAGLLDETALRRRLKDLVRLKQERRRGEAAGEGGVAPADEMVASSPVHPSHPSQPSLPSLPSQPSEPALTTRPLLDCLPPPAEEEDSLGALADLAALEERVLRALDLAAASARELTGAPLAQPERLEELGLAFGAEVRAVQSGLRRHARVLGGARSLGGGDYAVLALSLIDERDAQLRLPS